MEMASYEVINREEVESWGTGDGHAEVQAVKNKDTGEYKVRPCHFQDNGRFGQSAPTLSPDEDVTQRVIEAYEKMATVARKKQREERLNEIDDLIQQVGLDRAKDILQVEAEKDGIEQIVDDSKRASKLNNQKNENKGETEEVESD